MEASESDPSYGWHDIQEHHLILRGIQSLQTPTDAALTLTAHAVLSHPDLLHSPDAISFDTNICIADESATLPIQYRRKIGFYGSLATVRSDIAAIRSGTGHEATLSMAGLALRLFTSEFNSHNYVCVDGTLSNVIDESLWSWPPSPNNIAPWTLRNQKVAYCMRFAFLLSLVDPPHLDNFIHDIDNLLTHLQELAPS